MGFDKLSMLGGAAKYDICASTSSNTKKIKNAHLGSPSASGICHSFTPDGRCVSLLKVLMTNECQRDCGYCVNRCHFDIPRLSFEPLELSNIFIELYKRNYVEGLFLSSGIKNSTIYSMEKMLQTAEILRNKFKFGGYIHLKILPGSTPDLIEQAAKLANRISLNLEVPNENRLKMISRTKHFTRDLLDPLRTAGSIIARSAGTSQTTQFVVGAAKETDREILESVTRLYSVYHVKRAYFSAFTPVPGTPLEYQAPTPLKRENRLYQADFLLRFYRFSLSELYFTSTDDLDLSLDPKLMYAVNNPHLYPIEINHASRFHLLRVPGIGPKSAYKIVQARQTFRFSTLEELKNVGAVIKRAAPFITINGRKFDRLAWLTQPSPQKFTQLSFW